MKPGHLSGVTAFARLAERQIVDARPIRVVLLAHRP
jgi:hypothetical protein